MKTVSQLSDRVGGQVFGDGASLIERVASLESAGARDIAYVEDEKFFAAAGASQAACLLVPKDAGIKAPCRIEVSNPKLAFALIAEILHPPKKEGRKLIRQQ